MQGQGINRFLRRPAALCLLALFCLPAAAAPESPGLRARRILAEIDDLWRADSSYAVLSMKVVTAHYTRTVTMECWTLGKEKSLVRIVSPLKEKGTITLKSGNAVYTYLPKTDRTIRLTASMMLGSWMGSHFTNDDLVKDSRLSDDYDPELLFEGERDGRRIFEFALHPKPEAPVVWGRIEITVLADGYLPLVSRYYDEDGVLARTLHFSRIEKMGGRMLPTLMRMVPTDKPDEYTELVYEKLDFGVKLDSSFFSLQELRRR